MSAGNSPVWSDRVGHVPPRLMHDVDRGLPGGTRLVNLTGVPARRPYDNNVFGTARPLVRDRFVTYWRSRVRAAGLAAWSAAASPATRDRIGAPSINEITATATFSRLETLASADNCPSAEVSRRGLYVGDVHRGAVTHHKTPHYPATNSDRCLPRCYGVTLPSTPTGVSNPRH